MKWYTDYLSAYEKPYSELPPPLTNRVKKRIRELQHPNPLVSVVVIAHNEENRIFSCLWSICENNCHFPIEIIVINNHSTDNTESILKKLGVTYYNEEQKGPGFARQCGLNHAKGKYCVCIDSDSANRANPTAFFSKLPILQPERKNIRKKYFLPGQFVVQ